MLTRATRFLRLRFGRPYVRAADRHRDGAEWIEAAIGYRRALEWLPWRDDLHIQVGNCLKEFGDYRGAVRAYGTVTAGAHRSEALRQIADATRRAGTGTLPYDFAERSAHLPISGDDEAPAIALRAQDLPNRVRIETIEPRRWLGSLGREAQLAPPPPGGRQPSIVFDQVGALTMARDGVSEPLLAGVVAIRARIFSPARMDMVELWLDEGPAERRIAIEPVRRVDCESAGLRLHVANIWLDSARLPAGRHWLAIRAGDHAPAKGLFVNVAQPDARAPEVAGSDAYVPTPAVAEDDVAAAVIAAPAQSRAAARSLFDRPIRSILVIRVDQLGDVSASLPALARLRTIFPGATIAALVQPGVRAVIESSRLADAVQTITLAYDAASGARYLAPAEEARVRGACAERHFDLAIDLSTSDESRPLLLLSNATYLVGFNADRFPFLDYGIGVRSRDKVNQLDIVSHAAMVTTLVEALAIAVTPARPIVPRVAPADAALAVHGLAAGSHVVLHTGARHAINRWPAERFLELAERLLEETALTVVIFSDERDRQMPAKLSESSRVRWLDVIDGDTFDAIVSTARLMIGNDSGPKHLAAARGVPAVSVHVNRLNWNEWGQDGRGTILSKRVPCAGCGLNDVALCGRDAVCVRSIRVDEVLAAARPFL